MTNDSGPADWKTRTQAANQKRKENRRPPWREKKNPITTQHPRGVWFLSGKPPMEQIAKAFEAGKVAAQVYLVALMVRGMERQDTVTPNRSHWAQMGLTRNQRHRGLKALEDAQLILVKRKAGSLPSITFLWRGDAELLDVPLKASDYSLEAVLGVSVCDQTSGQ